MVGRMDQRRVAPAVEPADHLLKALSAVSTPEAGRPGPSTRGGTPRPVRDEALIRTHTEGTAWTQSTAQSTYAPVSSDSDTDEDVRSDSSDTDDEDISRSWGEGEWNDSSSMSLKDLGMEGSSTLHLLDGDGDDEGKDHRHRPTTPGVDHYGGHINNNIGEDSAFSRELCYSNSTNNNHSNSLTNQDGDHHVLHDGLVPGGDRDDGDGTAPLPAHAPEPPRHFLCPIQNTLLVDPVIDREGNTYEREAVLRWLVLTSANFDGGAVDGGVGRGTSPITGNPLSAEELVEDRIVKSAIERWRRECWVRFILSAEGYRDGDERVQFLMDDEAGVDAHNIDVDVDVDVGDRSANGKGSLNTFKAPSIGEDNDGAKPTRSMGGHKSKSQKSTSSHKGHGSDGHRSHKIHKSHSGDGHKSHSSKERRSRVSKHKEHKEHKSKHHSKHSSHSHGKHKEHKKAAVNESWPPPPPPQASKATSKQYPPPPKPSSRARQERNSNGLTNSHTSHVSHTSRNSHAGHTPGPGRRSNRSSGKEKSGLASSQKTSTTSNTTPPASRPHPFSNAPPEWALTPPPPFAVSPQAPAPRDPSSSPPLPIRSIVPVPHSSGNSFCSNLSNPNDLFSLYTTAAADQTRARHNGWSVPLGVHKVVCAAPGLRATTQVHRRSVPVRVSPADGAISKELIVPPGSYVEILETQVHGDRVRGRIRWEVEEEDAEAGNKKGGKKGGIKGRTSRLLKLKRTSRRRIRDGSEERATKVVEHEGWISLQWARGEDDGDNGVGADDGESHGGESGGGSSGRRLVGAADEDAGPWTEPVPLGVYRINFGGGLPLRESSERDSAVLCKLERGRCVEVVQTQVKGDRVRARVMFEREDGGDGPKFTSGWISLMKLRASSGASPVPLGAYVVVAEPGCVVTEGGRLDSKVRGNVVQGSCVEVVATRMEEGVVRGLVASGGHISLFVPPGARKGNSGRGGRMFAMPVPLGTYQIIQGGLPVTSSIASTSPVATRLPLDAFVEVVETRVENGRVRGRVIAVGDDGGDGASGWIPLFEPNQRWAKILCFKGGRPVGGVGTDGASRCRIEHKASC